jgi:hypothetical protein
VVVLLIGSLKMLLEIYGMGVRLHFRVMFGVGDLPLRYRFPLTLSGFYSQSLKLGEMGSWVDGVWSWDLVWRRRLFLWEQFLVVKLLVVLDARSLSAGADSCSWNFLSDGIYSVGSAYESLSKEVLGVGGGVIELSHLLVRFWKSWAPSNVHVFSW